jgi:hypothetical protein
LGLLEAKKQRSKKKTPPLLPPQILENKIKMEYKKEKVKSLTSRAQIKLRIDFLQQENIFHKLILSNYTTTIETPSQIIKYNDRMMSNKAFLAYAMIRRDINNFTANGMPDIDRAELDYFDTYIEKPLNQMQVFCVDIKSAYATVLFNDGFICADTFRYINILPKKARLAAVGMLASRKDVFYFQGAELNGHDKIINPMQNYFWYCVKRTAEIMKEIAAETKPLFFWVDGIYFQYASDAAKCCKMLDEQKYKYSQKKCFMFEAQTKESKRGDILNKISFYECKNNELEYENATKKDLDYKVFSIPVRKRQKEDLVNYLINKK